VRNFAAQVDMELSSADPDSPLLWLRFDPELVTAGRVRLQQPDYQWQLMLRHERDVLAQLLAARLLPHFPTPHSRLALGAVLRPAADPAPAPFHRVRQHAAHALALVANKMAGTGSSARFRIRFSLDAGLWTGSPALLDAFHGLFGSKSCPKMPRLNDFSNAQHYFLAQAMISAMATLRNSIPLVPGSFCPPEVRTRSV